MDKFVKFIIGVALFILFISYFSLDAVTNFNDEIIAGMLGITTEQIEIDRKERDKVFSRTNYVMDETKLLPKNLEQKDGLLRILLFLSYVLIIYFLWKIVFNKKN